MLAMGGVATKTLDDAAIMAVLESVPDPEIPVLTITDLGIVRGIRHDPPRVLISPTYTGCPATVAIETSIRAALDTAGFEEVHIERVLFPPWSTEWITRRGRERLQAGLAAPLGLARGGAEATDLDRLRRAALRAFDGR
jgi:ring-1,2-phenylacetyl-CoA epoxidase subunit PaaD